MTGTPRKITKGQKAAAVFMARRIVLEPKPAAVIAAEQRNSEEDLASEIVNAAASAVANDEAGYLMPDGTIYGGVSPDTGKPMYTTPRDEPSTMYWDGALRAAQQKEAYGHEDWFLPTKGELNVLFNNRAAIGGFAEPSATASEKQYTDAGFPWSAAGWYWSSSLDTDNYVWGLNFNDGKIDSASKDCAVFVRLVRG